MIYDRYSDLDFQQESIFSSKNQREFSRPKKLESGHKKSGISRIFLYQKTDFFYLISVRFPSLRITIPELVIASRS